MNLNEDEKTTYWIAKGLAVIAIVACHCCHVSENASALNQISYKFMNLWMGLGVPVFYFFAGYFMNTRIGWRDFWKKKVYNYHITVDFYRKHGLYCIF